MTSIHRMTFLCTPYNVIPLYTWRWNWILILCVIFFLVGIIFKEQTHSKSVTLMMKNSALHKRVSNITDFMHRVTVIKWIFSPDKKVAHFRRFFFLLLLFGKVMVPFRHSELFVEIFSYHLTMWVGEVSGAESTESFECALLWMRGKFSLSLALSVKLFWETCYWTSFKRNRERSKFFGGLTSFQWSCKVFNGFLVSFLLWLILWLKNLELFIRSITGM